MKKILLLLFVLASSLISNAEGHEYGYLNENRYRAAAGHNPYEAPEFVDTPAPRGYKPVYVSHYSRHGSRYQGSRHSFEKVLPVMDTLAKSGLLTPVGDSLRHELHLMYEAHDDKEALLTQKGSREQREVAERLYRRVPKMFGMKKARQVHCVSTSAQRTLQSMMNFATALKGAEPDLEITYETGDAKLLHYLAPRFKPEEKIFVRSHYEPLQDSLLNVSVVPKSLAARLFTDPAKAQDHYGDRTEAQFVYEIFEAAQGAGCLDIDVDPLRFFSLEELHEFLQIRNLYFCANYGPLAPTKELRTKAVLPLARGIVKEADAALAGNGHCADFRFGHDGGMGPLFMLIGVEGFDKPVDPQNALARWQAWKYIPMCSNLQMIFYRNRKGDTLVKFLRNENESLVPALTPVHGVYYRWEDVRRHILTRTGDYKELPEYYVPYLDGKADEIARLKAKEASGFFFWTDTHFPDNAGNTAAILEYMQKKLGPCMLFNGGDVALNADRLAPGIEANTSSWLQAGLCGTLLPVRGNHDYTSSTSAKVKSPQTMGNLEVNEYISSFLSPFAVVPQSAGTANYYYVDDAKGKIRYIVLDSTDSVKDDRVKYGISAPQYQWIFNDAVASTPKGWSIFLLSHVPLAADHAGDSSLVAVGKKIAALAESQSVLMALCGHRHSDAESGIGSVFQVITAGDCLVDMGRIRTPYSLPADKKQAGTVNEQTIDYVSISKDHSKITMKRIGYGHDRIFNVNPLEASVGGTIALKSSLEGPVKWFVYDAEGNTVIQSEDGWDRIYVTSHKNASVSPDGIVKILAPGSVIAVATHEAGTKEYFMITPSTKI